MHYGRGTTSPQTPTTRERSITDTDSERSNLQDRLRLLRRRKWIILQAVILVPAAAVAYSLHQQAQYEASADVLLNSQNAVQNIAGTAGLLSGQDLQRFMDTQAALAREPAVARKVVGTFKAAGLTVDQFLQNSSVSEKQGANLLVFRVTDHLPARAVHLAAKYARQYVFFERELDTRALQAAIAKVRDRIAELGPRQRASALYASLSDKEQQLETALTLQTSTASVVRIPSAASQVQPRPVRNGILGLVLGLIIGLALALFRDSLDSKARTADEIESETGLTLLARLPRPRRKLRRKNRLVMLADPFGPHAETVRALRRNVEFTNVQAQARTVMVTSAVEREGKSTTAANLAVALARTGARVVLVDLDLRRPFLHRFFDHHSRPGITDVVLDQVELADALFEVPVGLATVPPPVKVTRSSRTRTQAAPAPQMQSLGVLPAGQLPPDPGEFVGTQALAATLAEVREQADLIIIDSPPLLPVSDSLTLSNVVDAMIVVARIEVVRQEMLAELHRLLGMCPATKLGFVLTGADLEEGRHGYGRYYYRPHTETENDPRLAARSARRDARVQARDERPRG